MHLTPDPVSGPSPEPPGWPTGITAVVCDYGGVLTNPLFETLDRFSRGSGLEVAAIVEALKAATERYGASPMAELEVGAITEGELVARISAELPQGSWSLPEGMTFGRLWFAGRTGNPSLVAFLRELRFRGYRLALLTNNVMEWEELWRATVPADELFEVVVNSAHEHVRKPDPEIYRRLLARLDLKGEQCLFVDDVPENLVPAQQLGMHTVHFTDTDRATASIRDLLGLTDHHSDGGEGPVRTGRGQEAT
jgi:putative hydrolase of the HAD superfamily